jgi:phosphoribosylanthranilate isomerase
MEIEVKICGLSTAQALTAAVRGGARYVGFVFFAASPRRIAPEHAAALGRHVPAGVSRVGLVVDAADDELDALVARVPLDMLQLHGAEPPERVADVRQRLGLPVIKAVPIAERGDLVRARAYEVVADRLLFDARPPAGATRPGGNASPFEWGLVRGVDWRIPWFLAGGLDATNVAEAVRRSGARAVDVSSGVEAAPGIKSIDKIEAFLTTVTNMDHQGAAYGCR